MITFEVLERGAEEERRKQEKFKEAEKQKEDRRAELEQERWGTPESAYRTWESRTRRIIEIANEYAASKKGEAERARERHKNTRFDLFIDRQIEYEERSCFGLIGKKKTKTQQTKVGTISPLDFSAVERNNFYPLRNGKGTFEYRRNDDYPREYLIDHDFKRLEKMVGEIFGAKAVERTVDYYATKCGRKFFEMGHVLRQNSVGYSFRCNYYSDATEDNDTDLKFGNVTADVMNPYHIERIHDILYRMAHPPSCGTSQNHYHCPG